MSIFVQGPSKDWHFRLRANFPDPVQEKFFTRVTCELRVTISGIVARMCFCSWKNSLVYHLCSIFIDRKSCFLKIICDWRLLRLYRRNLIGNVSGLALHTMTSITQTWTELCFCFLDNSTQRQFSTVRSYSLALNYITVEPRLSGLRLSGLFDYLDFFLWSQFFHEY